jgi:hypothetical protein
MLMNWKLWLAVAVIAAVAGAAFNWSWLVAAGLVPILLAVVPCLAMCALSLCARRGSQERTGGRLSFTHWPRDAEATRFWETK